MPCLSTHLRVFLFVYNSFQNYTDYFKCIAAKGEDYAPCKQFKRAYNSLCPSQFPCLFSSSMAVILTMSSMRHLSSVLLAMVFRRMGMFNSPGRVAMFLTWPLPDRQVG